MVKFCFSFLLFAIFVLGSINVVAKENNSNLPSKTSPSLSNKVANNTTPIKPFYNLSQLENYAAGLDPYEPFNRSMFSFNKFLMDYIVKPVGIGYTTILPRPVINCLDNAFSNLEWPFRALSSLASGQYSGAKDETLRFLINTTLGLGGLFDVSRSWFNIYPTERDFGLAFASWGISPGESLVLPLVVKNNVRDITGSLFDSIFDGKSYIPFSSAPIALNTAVVNYSLFQNVLKGSLDPYSAFRASTTLNRAIQYKMLKYKKLNYFSSKVPFPNIPKRSLFYQLSFFPPGVTILPNGVKYVKLNNYYSLGPYQDTLRITFLYPKDNFNFWYMRLSAFNNDFSKRCQNRTISLDPKRKELEYGFWESPTKGPGPVKEKLLIILPGIGGSYNSTTPESLASVFNIAGYKVVTIDSTFTWQFYAARTKGDLPGNTYNDCQEIRRALYKIITSLKEDKKIINPEITLMGYSLGALHTLKIAQLETLSGNPFNFYRYLAINPPADLQYAINKAEELSLCYENWTIDQTIDNLANIACNMMLLPYVKKLDTLELVGLSKEQARFISGLYFRASLRELLYSVYQDGYLPFVKVKNTPNRRNKLYTVLDKVSFKEYAQKALVPNSGLTYEQLLWISNLRSMAKELKNNKKIRVVHNVDDFLLSKKDHRFLNRTLGNRLVWFSNGGHLGNLYLDEVQKQLLELIQ